MHRLKLHHREILLDDAFGTIEIINALGTEPRMVQGLQDTRAKAWLTAGALDGIRHGHDETFNEVRGTHDQYTTRTPLGASERTKLSSTEPDLVGLEPSQVFFARSGFDVNTLFNEVQLATLPDA